MEKELVELFNSLSEEKQQMFIEYLKKLISDGKKEQ